MKLLQDILDEHFLSSDKKELFLMFKKYDIFEIITKISDQLKIQLQRDNVIDNKAPIVAITATSSNFLVSVNSVVIKISNPLDKRRIEESLAQIGLRMLLSIIKQFPDNSAEIFEAVKQSLQMTSELFGYNYSEINELMKFEEFIILIQTLNGKRYADELKEIKKTEIESITWTNRVPIGYLTTELKKRKWIKSQSEFSKLFSNSNRKLQVHWDLKYKYELAYLLYVLAKGDFIRPKKGFFSVPEKFIVDFSGTKLKENSLKKISSKITNDSAKYTDFIDKVDQIIKIITK